MYVTRPLSLYNTDPSALSSPPPEGPNSGILVIEDEEAEPTCCFGLSSDNRVRDLPFPQNKNLRVKHSSGGGPDRHSHDSINRVVFIPVLNQPLSSNRYYVIERKGRHKGEAHTNATEEDVATCCFGCCIPDMEPEALDPKDVYQQFEIRKRDWGGFVAKSVAPDGFPPHFLRRKGWRVYTSIPDDFQLSEAPGLDARLRARLPDFHFPLQQKCSPPVVVGKWYCPFMFIREGTLKDQINRSRYYEMTLEQRWEQIFARGSSHIEGNSVDVDVVVRTEVVAVAGREASVDERHVADGVMWFTSSSNVGAETSIGLSSVIMERMMWEQERVGWVGVPDKQVRIKRVEEDYKGSGDSRRFGSYVLVERFVLKRMDRSVVLTYDFKHTHHVRSTWE